MNILILGATGLIGSAVAKALRADGHNVNGLARTSQAAETIRAMGIRPVMGDLRMPERWIKALHATDALIHCAATWDDDMGDVDQTLTQHIIHHRTAPLRVLYTGGCWLFGATGDKITIDTSPRPGFGPFNWMLSSARSLLAAPNLSTAVLHPAMVDDGMRGAMERYYAAVQAGEPIQI